MDVGNYTLLHLLGRGGTSEVYAAKHRERAETVAIKILQTTELAPIRTIEHPNVVRTIEIGHNDSSSYVVMELIEGETLAARLRRSPIVESELRELGAAIADGMQAAHALGIVHRDLKPGNVMLRGNVPVIVDFGIAKSLGASTAAVTERRIGTVAYMAPEQLVEGLITPAVDIWALGVTLYEAATGELPFKSFVDGRLPQLFESAPRITTTSPAFADLVARCLDRDPGKRPASMADIARALRSDDVDRVTADIGSTTADNVERPVPRPSKARWPMIFGLGGVAAIAATVVVLRTPSTDPPTAPLTPTAIVPAVPTDGGVAPVVVPPSIPASPDVVASPDVGTSPNVVASPVVERPPARPKRVKSRPKKRTTSQGETLD